MKFFFKGLLGVTWTILFLCGCEVSGPYAPVIDITKIDAIPRSNIHRVEDDETLYSIAWRYALDFRTLAAINRIQPPYELRSGQLIYLEQAPRQTPPPRPLRQKNTSAVQNCFRTD